MKVKKVEKKKREVKTSACQSRTHCAAGIIIDYKMKEVSRDIGKLFEMKLSSA
jgi:hypothetical protein